MRSNIETPISSIKLGEGLSFEDDWFAVKHLDEGTLAIGEPAYHQRNWSYLLYSGNDCLLFDTGSGRRPIKPLLNRYVNHSIQAFPSHMHFDHLGNINAFEHIIVADLPELRAIENAGKITPPDFMFLGVSEGMEPPTFEVSRWIKPGETLSIGNRQLEILHTPGHSPDSISLWEAEHSRLYAADFIYRGTLYAQTPNASLNAYFKTAEQLLELLPRDVHIVCAHGHPENGIDKVPELGFDDLLDLRNTLKSLLVDKVPSKGETPINENMSLRYSHASFVD